jgi:hypothetical protein
MENRPDNKLNEREKKEYAKPQVVIYGDVLTVTQAITMFHPTMDGGMAANTRT